MSGPCYESISHPTISCTRSRNGRHSIIPFPLLPIDYDSFLESDERGIVEDVSLR